MAFPLRERALTGTYIDGALKTRLDTGTLKRRGNLVSHRLALDLRPLRHLGHFSRKLQLLLGSLGPLHRDDDSGVGKAVGGGKIDPVMLYVGDHHGLRAPGLAHGGAQETHGSGPEYEDGGRRRETGSVVSVHGDG